MINVINTTFNVPDYIDKGLKAGKLFRYGSEIRISKGFEGAGQVLVTLKEVTEKAQKAAQIVNKTSQTWKALGSIAKNSAQAGAINPILGILTATVGVADLGVNIWGHTKTHKKLDEGFENTNNLINENFEATNKLIDTGFSNTSYLINNVMSIASVGSAASVLNLGISGVGFVMMNHKINNLTKVTKQLHDSVNNISGSLDNISNQILELKYLQLEHQNEMKVFIKEALFQSKFDEILSNIRTYIEFIYEGRVDNQLLLNIRKERNYLADTIDKILSKDKDYSLGMINIHRAWVISGMAEVFALRMMKELDKSAEIAIKNSINSREWSNTLIDKLSLNKDLNGIYLYGNSCFEDKITEEQKKRLSIMYEKGEILDESSLIEKYLVGSEKVLLLNPSKEWENKEIALANTLDMLEEMNERVDSLANEVKYCTENSLLPENWELMF